MGFNRRASLGAVFSDGEVASLYRHRAPYPDEVHATLRSLLVEPHTILDVGAGTGALAREMVGFAKRVDAIDPSAAMIDVGRGLPGGADRRLRWIVGYAEDAPISAPYGLITAGASLHWLDPDVALPRLRDALAPGAMMAVTDLEVVHGPYQAEVREIIRDYSELDHHTETPQLMEELHAAGRFSIEGQRRTAPVAFEQAIDDYLGALHSTSTLARVRLGDRSPRFDAEVRAVFARRRLDRVRYDVIGLVAWGRPT